VITTDAFPNLLAISGQADKNTKIVNSPTAKQMIACMVDCDLAVSSGGQTLYELACVGTPTITVTEIKNQVLNVKYLNENNVTVSAGEWDDLKCLDTITTQIHNMRSKIKRKRHSELGQLTIDGQGSLRIAHFLQECIPL
jgi:spore coat polysaccharide biosynthesis predicted glycosyltransferase SpsG